MPFEIKITAFAQGGDIPEIHTCDGANISPAIEWQGGPPTALSYALIVDDPDAPGGAWNHWLVCDIPKGTTTIAQGARTGSIGVSGMNDFGKLGYGGPCPPRGQGAHHYNFRLMALNVASLGLREGEKRDSLDIALRGHVLVETTHRGLYKRR